LVCKNIIMKNFLSDIANPISVIRGCYILKKRSKFSKKETKELNMYLLSNIEIVEELLCKLLGYSVS
jgi:hypothetical protein